MKMMKIRVFWFVIGVLIATAGASIGATYVVQGGDTLSKIAQNYSGVSWQEICRANNLPNCDRINVGQRLEIPDGSTASAPVTSAPAKKASKDVFDWRRVGADPVVKSNTWHRGNSAGKLELTSKQKARLMQISLLSSEVEKVAELLEMGACNMEARAPGHTWSGMGFGKGSHRGVVKNATGGYVDVWACPAVGNKQIDIAMGCGNPAVNHVSPPPKIPQQSTKVDEETGLSCDKIATAWAQGELNGRFINASARMGCLFDIGPNSKLGPVIGGQINRYWGKDGWTEKGWFVGLGPEFRMKPAGGLDSFEVFLIAGPAFAEGGNGEVARSPSHGLDAHLGVTMEKTVLVGEKTAMTIRFMPFAHAALTNRMGDLSWQGNPIGEEVARKHTAGAVLRLEFDNAEWKLRPELTVGGWYVWDVIDPWGAKILVGFSTKDKVWRLGVGAQYSGMGWVPIAEIEYNPILGKMLLSAQKADDALTTGATSSSVALGVEASATSQIQKAYDDQRRQVIRKKATQSSTTSGSPFGWAQDAQHRTSTPKRNTGKILSTGGKKLSSGIPAPSPFLSGW